MICDENKRLVWSEHFPPVYGHTSISYLKRCSGFRSAKNGDLEAALEVAALCVKDALIVELKQKYPDAILLPVMTNNKLPMALAMISGLEVCSKIHMCNPVCRKSLSAMERLLYLPVFSGEIRKAEQYIIVDDVITQGGTVSELRKHVLMQGGLVAAVTALACAIDSGCIAPDAQDISSLKGKFNHEPLSHVLREYHIANDPCELTKSQIKYLLRFNKLHNITHKLETVSNAAPM